MRLQKKIQLLVFGMSLMPILILGTLLFSHDNPEQRDGRGKGLF